MKTIWKFQLPVTDDPVVTMPEGARVLHVAPGDTQYVDLWLWAEVDSQAPTTDRAFRIVGTGHPLPAVGAHIGTVQAGPLVWHIYEDPDA